MNEFELGCSIEHHFKRTQLTDSEYEEKEKQRLLTFSKDERSLWCWICGFMIDPCDFRTPREGVEAFEQHRKNCEQGWREINREEEEKNARCIYSI